MSESKMSSLGRAFTTRRGLKTSDAATLDMPKRSQTTKKQQSMANLRSKISLPVELISTTNNSYQNMPFISELNGYKPSPIKHTTSVSSRSSNSADESDRSPTGTSTPMSSPDTSSVEGSPTTVEPNHLSCYFGGPSRQSTSSVDAPIIPQRAQSHTKRSAEVLAHQRSISRISTTSTAKSSHQSMASARNSSQKNSLSLARSSINMFSANPESVEPHPFGKELAQVSELAEEYSSVTDSVIIVDPEEQELVNKGFFKFSADQYMAEIQGFWQDAYCDTTTTKPLVTALWI